MTRLEFKHLRLVAAVLAAGVAASPAVAGPWVQPRGGSYGKLSASYLYTRTELDVDGHEVPILNDNPLVESAAYREMALFAYVEHGLFERVTLFGSMPFKIATSTRTEISEDASLRREIDVTNAGWSDLFLGARGALRRGRYPIAVESGVKIPLGYDAEPENGGPALGTGEPDFEAALLAGFGAAHVYGSARAAYRVCGGDLDDQVGFRAEIGGSHRGVFAQALVEGWYTTGDMVPLDVSSTVRIPNQDLLKLIASAGVRTTKHAAVVAELYHVLDGRNTPTGTTVALGIVFQKP